MIKIKRVYEASARSDGKRFLVDRLWPRGLKKEALPLAAWVKEVAPSNELRQWFRHDPLRWRGFQKRYLAELDEHPENSQALLKAAEEGDLTLLFSAHDTEHNNAVVLRDYLNERLKAAAK